MSKKKTDTSKPWGGRFREATLPDVEAFTQSLDVDIRLADADIRQSRAHAAMLAATGIIRPADAAAIDKGLQKIANELRDGTFPFDARLEDIHMNIETRLAALIGPVAGKLHTARSRNDQVATDFKLYVKDVIPLTIGLIREFQSALVDTAEANAELVIPGYTHLQQAQPVTAGHHLMAYFYMMERDAGRFADALKRADTCPLGAGALAGTALPIDREMTAKALGFAMPTENSMDAVSDRDFAMETASAAAVCAVHLSRFAEELITWMSQEFALITLPDSICTGSSIMPHKKNPDIAELTRGKSARVIAGLVQLLTLMKGLPLTYNRDMQEDKQALFDSMDTLTACLKMMTLAARGMKFNGKRATELVGGSFLNSVDLTDYLVLRGAPFRMTHDIVGRVVRYCEENGKTFRDLTLEELKKISTLFEKGVMAYLPPEASVARKQSAGSASAAEVKKQIRKARRTLEKKAP